MKLIGLLSWFDESVTWLAASIGSMMRLGMDHVIAIDGAYDLYPNGRRMSGSEEHVAIYDACTATGMGCTVHVPTRLWKDEMEKRDTLFALAEYVAESDQDWFFSFDADHIVTDVLLHDFKATLAGLDTDAASVCLYERFDPHINPKGDDPSRLRWTPLRCAFRNVGGIHTYINHCTYVDKDDRWLWGNARQGAELIPSTELFDVRIEHRTMLRDPTRKLEAKVYYDRRRRLNTERPPCRWCNEPGIVQLPNDLDKDTFVPFDPSGEPGDEISRDTYKMGWIEVCDNHVRRAFEQVELKALARDVPVKEVRAIMVSSLRAAGRNPKDYGIPE